MRETRATPRHETPTPHPGASEEDGENQEGQEELRREEQERNGRWKWHKKEIRRF
jgi:hypothetical protein